MLEIRNLRVEFTTYKGRVKVLNGINLTLYEGEIFGLVGESGCGKSVTALTVAGLLPENADIVSGEILLKGRDLLKNSKEAMRKVRSNDIAMVFQDPMTFLNPVLTIGTQIEEAIEVRFGKDRTSEAALPDSKVSSSGTLQTVQVRGEETKREGKKQIVKAMAIDVLKKVRLPDPERIMKSYPHELSGGMRQRTMIAMALARSPVLLVADEITTALDVTIQAQILELLRILRNEVSSTIVVITHDLGVVAEVCDRVGVMYAGDVVEVATVREIFAKPSHPYTQGLLNAIPSVTGSEGRLVSVAGSVPDLIDPPPACRFNPRCPYVMEICKRVKPELLPINGDHTVACYLYHKGEGA
ncbi:MAG: ABC transporter ATP-binding protein [Nitrososphaerales archaeon]|nr:ABC transporter ATP-binding protein [Nitrososphaerales archaeon]